MHSFVNMRIKYISVIYRPQVGDIPKDDFMTIIKNIASNVWLSQEKSLFFLLKNMQLYKHKVLDFQVLENNSY